MPRCRTYFLGLTMLCVACLADWPATAQQPVTCTQAAQDTACGCRKPGCAKCCRPPCQPPCQPPCKPPCQPPVVPNQLLYAPQETGAYVAPPLVGTTQGAAERVGVESGGITFPELRIRLPRLEMPSVFRSRSSARMLFEGGEAPWQTSGVTNTFAAQNEALLAQQVAQLQQQLAVQQPASDTTQAEAQAAKAAAEQFLAATQDELARLRCEVNRLRALEECLEQAKENAARNPDCQRPSPKAAPTPVRPEPIQPLPSPEQSGRIIYPARPVAYTGNPSLIEPPSSNVIREPEPRRLNIVIREPQARIRGVRSR